MLEGATKKCLEHYSNSFVSSGNRLGAVALIAEFVSVNSRTAQDWLGGKVMPSGERLIRLQIFLELVGYKVSELSKLSTSHPVIYRLAEVIGLGLNNGDQMRDLLEFERTQSVYRLIRSDHFTSPEREFRIANLHEHLKEKIIEARQYWKDKIDKITLVNTGTVSHTISQNNGHNTGNQLVIETLAGLVGALTPMARSVANDFSSEERKRLRELVGPNGIFDLSNALNMLCSESARKEILANRRKA